MEFKGANTRNKMYFVVGKSLRWRDVDNVDILISTDINDYFMVIIKGFEQDPDQGVKCFHP